LFIIVHKLSAAKRLLLKLPLLHREAERNPDTYVVALKGNVILPMEPNIVFAREWRGWLDYLTVVPEIFPTTTEMLEMLNDYYGLRKCGLYNSFEDYYNKKYKLTSVSEFPHEKFIPELYGGSVLELLQNLLNDSNPDYRIPIPKKYIGCRNMRLCFKHGQKIRHRIRDYPTWVGVYDSITNGIVCNEKAYSSLSGLTAAHYAQYRPDRTTSSNGWSECECETSPDVWTCTNMLPPLTERK
jgi:hypothetical protein